jgi:carbamoyltransferase
MNVLSIKVGISSLYGHDCSVVLAQDGDILYGVEDERFTRTKHGSGDFPEEAIRHCLSATGLDLEDIDHIVLPYDPDREFQAFRKTALAVIRSSDSKIGRINEIEHHLKKLFQFKYYLEEFVESDLRAINANVPRITTINHHKSHAISAHHPSPINSGLIVTVDGRGEIDATVIWSADEEGVHREHTIEWPNSIGHFYAAVTEFLGYRAQNGEGKVMGLAPYGTVDEELYNAIASRIQMGENYDVTPLTKGKRDRVERLEKWLGKPRRERHDSIQPWHKDLAAVTQHILEEIMTDLVSAWCERLDTSAVSLSGGVALNCKMNKRVRELDCVDEFFVQPAAHDGGLAVGGALSPFAPSQVYEMTDVYLGPEYSTRDIKETLDQFKLDYERPDDITSTAAEYIADGLLLGWYQGCSEFGPRALGNRSILADPRTIDSRDRVNEFVKHREKWRPFAPSILEEAVDMYFEDASAAPFMIQTFDADPKKSDEIPAVLHQEDKTARPQTVRKDQNKRYYQLIDHFESITGVPVVLNTSFNDSGEPIVNRPNEAIKDFFSMGLDVLAIDDFILKK